MVELDEIPDLLVVVFISWIPMALLSSDDINISDMRRIISQNTLQHLWVYDEQSNSELRR